MGTTMPALRLIQDYRHCSDRVLMKYYRQHRIEYDERGDSYNRVHLAAITIVMVERGIGLEEQVE